MFPVKALYTGGMSRKATGSLGEKIAAQFLERKGFKVIECNFRKPWGEIDIIAVKDDVVRFVEVKTLSRVTGKALSREMSHQPEDLVDVRKLTKVARTAALYMDSNGDGREYQLDVVGVILDHKSRTARCRLLEQVL